MKNEVQFSRGLLFALGAFLMWGLAPLYFKMVADVPALEVLSHRVVWSVLMLAVVIGLRKQWRALRSLTWSTWRRLLLSAVFVSLNWLVFIWAVAQDRVLETSLGYFINPLVSVLIGVLFLAEKLRKMQLFAIGLAALGVMNQIWVVGALPWVALVLAFSFAFYGVIRKFVQIDPVLGLFVETLLLLPFALIYFAYLIYTESLMFMQQGIALDGLLIFAGVMTSLPLLFFAAGVTRLSLTTIGVTQYIAPSMTFFLAVFLFQEPFDQQQLLTFVCIWSGLFCFTIEGLYRARQSKAKVS
jgi:chloramphenicol-sensitive protein RarD